MKRLLLVVLFFAAAGSCAPSHDTECVRTGLTAEVESRIDTLVAGTLERNENIPGIILHVEVPSLCVSYDAAAGTVGRDSDAPLTEGHVFRIASNTKTYVAVSVLRLVEEGMIALDDPISDYLPLEYLGLLIYDGYEPDKMQIRHMLTHTSGMYEHAGNEYTDMIINDPAKKWSRLDQLKLAIDLGEPYGAAGETWRYSDTGYILLGKILEEVTGKTMALAMRDLIGFKRLGLENTWLEDVEEAPESSKERAHQYFGDIDSYDVDPSIDLYGGGGLVSTSRDLAEFVRLLFEGEVFRDRSTLDTMLSMSIAPDQGNYRAGIWSIDIDGMTGWGHTGFWNSFAFYFPESEITVAGAITQRNGLKGRALCDEAVRIIKDVMNRKAEG